jgi:anti-sigma regulatory factor (Ser/Thr protein kinase)
MNSGDTLDIRLSTRLEHFSQARHQIELFCARVGIPGIVQDRLILMLEELFTNVVMHSKEATTVTVKVIWHAGNLEVNFSDDGEAFDLFSEDISAMEDELEYRPIGKLGLPLIRALTSSGEYQRDGKWNRLLLQLPLET